MDKLYPEKSEEPVVSDPVETPSFPFTDASGHWARESIADVYGKGLMNGTSDTLFSPDEPLSRAMLTTVLYRLAGSPEIEGEAPFTDVPQGEWYSAAVLWASANGVVNGVGDGLFDPDGNVTREQMAAMLMRYYQLSAEADERSDLSTFDDYYSISDWALEAFSWANAKGLITGRTASSLAPDGLMTRAETATVLSRFCAME